MIQAARVLKRHVAKRHEATGRATGLPPAETRRQMIAYMKDPGLQGMSADMEAVVRTMLEDKAIGSPLESYSVAEVLKACDKCIQEAGDNGDGDEAPAATRILQLEPKPSKARPYSRAMMLCRRVFWHERSPWPGVLTPRAGLLYLLILEKSFGHGFTWIGKAGYGITLRRPQPLSKDAVRKLLVELETEGLIARAQLDHPKELRAWDIFDYVKSIRRSGDLKSKRQGLVLIPRDPADWNWEGHGGMHPEIAEQITKDREDFQKGLRFRLKEIPGI